MKTFKEFWNSIPTEEFERIAGDANAQVEKIIKETDNPKVLLGNQIAIISTTFTCELLRLYHDWLSEQLD